MIEIITKDKSATNKYVDNVFFLRLINSNTQTLKANNANKNLKK